MLLRLAIILGLTLQGALADPLGLCSARGCVPAVEVCMPDCCGSDPGAIPGAGAGSHCCCVADQRPEVPAPAPIRASSSERVIAIVPLELMTPEPGADPGAIAPIARAHGVRVLSTHQRLALLCVRTT